MSPDNNIEFEWYQQLILWTKLLDDFWKQQINFKKAKLLEILSHFISLLTMKSFKIGYYKIRLFISAI